MIKITVRQNIARPPPGKKVEVDLSSDTFYTFLITCSKTMNLDAKRVFDARGIQIHTISELINQEIYYVSQGENFVQMFSVHNSIVNILPTNSSGAVESESSNRVVIRSASSPSKILSQIDATKLFKIALIGESRVGKSAIVSRLLYKKFRIDYTSTLEDVYSITTTVDEFPSDLEIVDTGGEEENKQVTQPRLKEMDGFIIVYDTTQLQTFTNLDSQLEYIVQNNTTDKAIILVGNKIDGHRQVIRDQGERYATDRKLPYIECSSLTGENTEEVFHLIVRELRKHLARRQENISPMPQNNSFCDCKIF